LVGVSQPTIVALEGQEGRERLDTLERVRETLGAGAYLAPGGQAKAFYAHAGNTSVSHEWETPRELLEALHAVFCRFDLDPCAPRRSRTRVKAKEAPHGRGRWAVGAMAGVAFVRIHTLSGVSRRDAKGRRDAEQRPTWSGGPRPRTGARTLSKEDKMHDRFEGLALGLLPEASLRLCDPLRLCAKLRLFF
jgi:hypothetical protein